MMQDQPDFSLPDGRRLRIELWTLPIPPQRQAELIALYRTEWNKTDFDWLDAMNGDYSDTLVIQAAIARLDADPVATASVYYPVREPQVALIGNVLTHRDCRGLGIARRLTDRAARQAFAAGCRVCYLGATRSQRSLYLHCGFEWVSGGVMRRPAPDGEAYEAEAFAPGQATAVRGAVWADMPGLACLLAQPAECLVADYPRGLYSTRYVPMTRCVSNFPAIWYDVQARGGVMCVLAGANPHRILGFGSLTPGPGAARRHRAVIDAAAHDHYGESAKAVIDWLIARCPELGIRAAEAYVASTDKQKAAWFASAGFRPAAELPRKLHVDGRDIDVTVLERSLS